MKKLFILFALLFSSTTLADITCQGEVHNVLQYTDGSVNVLTSYRKGYMVMCNIDQHHKGTNPETCRGVLSVLLTAQSTGKKIEAYYSGNQYTCDTIPTYWQAPRPVYVGIVK